MKIEGVREEEVKVFLEKNYNLKIIKITYHPVGEVGASYIIETKGRKYFAKVFSKNSGVKRSVREIKIFIDFLYRAKYQYNFIHLSIPIKNKKQKLISNFKGFPVILENFISGKNPKKLTKKDYESIGETLGKLHSIDTKKFKMIKKEVLNFKRESKILKLLENLKKEYRMSSGEKKLMKLLLKGEKSLIEAVNFLKKHVEIIKSNQKQYVIVHEDLHTGNLLKNKNEIFLIDWEGVQLALPERDLMWFRKGLELKAPLEKEYKKSLKKNYKISKQNIKFYTLKRLLSDMTFFSQEIISRKESVREARGYLKEIKEEMEELQELLVN